MLWVIVFLKVTRFSDLKKYGGGQPHNLLTFAACPQEIALSQTVRTPDRTAWNFSPMAVLLELNVKIEPAMHFHRLITAL